MKVQTRTGSIVGETDDTHWAQTIKTPFAYGVVEVFDEGHGAQLAGMRIVVEITKLFETTLPPLSVVNAKLNSIREQGIATLIVFIPLGSTIAVLVRGKGSVYVKRNAQISLLASHEDSISGVAQKGDMFFLLTKTCATGIDTQFVLASGEEGNAEAVAEKLAVGMYEHNHHTGYAGLVIEITDIEDVNWNEEELQPGSTRWYVGQSATAQAERKKSLLPGFFKERGRKAKNKFHSFEHRFGTTNTRIVFGLVLLFFVSISIGIIREVRMKSDTEVAMVLSQASQLIEEGNALLSLNAVKSKETLLSAKALLDSKKSFVSPKTKEGRIMEDLYRQIEESLPRAAQEYVISPELFFDVSLVKSEARIDAMAMAYDEMVLLDRSTSTVFSLDLESKRGEIVAGGNSFSGTQYIGMHGSTGYVLSDNGIYSIDVEAKTVKGPVISLSDKWQRIESLVAFAGNVYLLDTGSGRVWKYVAVEKKDATASATMGITVMTKSTVQFSDIREYLNPDTLPDLSEARGMSIDGSVFMGSDNGVLWRFTQGRDDRKTPEGVEPLFGQALRMYKTDELDYVYVLDRDNKRVVVLDPDFVYKAQYRWTNQFQAMDLIVSETMKKILLLSSDGKLYSIDLK